jgi:hypothetical protein
MAAVLLGLWLAPRFYPRLEVPAAAKVKPPRDMLLRMGLGALLVLAVTYSAAQLGPSLSGILAMFPVMGTVLVLFTHRSAGAAATVQLLRGMVLGFYAFSTFCAVLAWTLTTAGIGLAFLWALAAAGLVQLLSRLWMSGPGLAVVRRAP